MNKRPWVWDPPHEGFLPNGEGSSAETILYIP